MLLGLALLVEVAWDELKARLGIFKIIDRKSED
jgi:hypothetical protein